MPDQDPRNFDDALLEELKTFNVVPEEHESIREAAHRARLCGLAFSGGGIRSATFNLGVLQGLARLGILDKFQYLSTVSGGGYIGSWLAAWIKRECGAPQCQADTDNQCSTTSKKAGEDQENGNTGQAGRKTCDSENKGFSAGGASVGDGSEETTKTVEKPPAEPPGMDGFRKVLRGLNASGKESSGKIDFKNHRCCESKPISHLREFSNYLTPRRGLWGNDTLTLAVAYARNLFLTVSVLLGALIAGVLFVHSAAVVYHHMLTFEDSSMKWGNFAAFTLFLAMASFFSSWDLTTCRALSGPRRAEIKGTVAVSRSAFWSTIVSIWFGAAGLWHLTRYFSGGWYAKLTDPGVLGTIGMSMAAIFMAVIVGGIAGRVVVHRRSAGMSETWLHYFKRILAHFKRILALLVGSTAMVFLIGLCITVIHRWLDHEWTAVIWGPLLVLIALSFFTTIIVGAGCRALDELEREWLARILAPITKWSVLFCMLTALVLYTPVVNQWLEIKYKSIWAALWAAISLAGIQLSRSGGSVVPAGTRRWIVRVVLAVSPVVIVTGFIVIITLGFNQWGGEFFNESKAGQGGWSVIPRTDSDSLATGMAIGIGALLFTLVWSCLVGVNTFSLHALYGNRLIRAFLGASNLDRRWHPFTGFDPRDNEVRLAELQPQSATYQGPFIIINAAINMVHGSRLAWQQRKAGSFTFTPLFCGYEFPPAAVDNGNGEERASGGYVLSSRYADGGKNGISLGKAMTISGAAASPNMGYHSSPALAFLMTIFNLRLGWWLPNTNTRMEKKEIFRRRGPLMGLAYLLSELLGMTSSRSRFVYVSDGGHFENLGIYELIRRRTRFILASDAAADPAMAFGDLGNAIERCRADFGVSIDLDPEQLKLDAEEGLSCWHCAVGKIRYSDVDADAKDGILVYIKASLTGDESRDIIAYKARHPDFPHETTIDQWFDEDQFESYRALGRHITEHVLEMPVHVTNERKKEKKVLLSERMFKSDRSNEKEMEDLFQELYKMYYPPLKGEETVKGNIDSELDDIFDEMRKDPMLSFLDLQFYPDVGNLIRNTNTNTNLYSPPRYVPCEYSELRAGFCFCKRLLQFMQRVYFERELDITYDAPSSRGWMNLFRRWSFSRMLRYTWSVTAGTYCARFQTFCEHHLRLDVGCLKWGAPIQIQYQEKESIDFSQTGIDFYENLLIKEFLYQHANNNRQIGKYTQFKVYPLVLETENPLIEEFDKRALINAGFAICGAGEKTAQENDDILYFRIRPTMRNMGLLSQALDFISLEDEINPMRFSFPDQEYEIENIGLKKRDAWRRRIYHEIYSMLMNRVNYEWLTGYSNNADVTMGKTHARSSSEAPVDEPVMPK